MSLTPDNNPRLKKMRRLLAPLILSGGLALALALSVRMQIGTLPPVHAAPNPYPLEELRQDEQVTTGETEHPSGASTTPTSTQYLPLIPLGWVPLPPPLAPPIPMSGTPPLDLNGIRADLQAAGKDLALVKVGFHVGPGGNRQGFGDYLAQLATAGVPAVVKSADDYGAIVEALNANPDNITIFRMTGGDLELPEYKNPAEEEAAIHWTRIMAALPPEFDQSTWLEVLNEPNKEKSDWLGTFAYHTALLALQNGYRFAAFGWSAGEPEPEHWETAGMLQFLRLASQHPDEIAVALHEYSLSVDDIGAGYPFMVGRFQALFQACDKHSIPRPTVLITEWGWDAFHVPDVAQSMEDIAWASWLYAAYPQVKSAAIWYLGGGFLGIADQAQKLIAPVRDYALSHYFAIEPGQGRIDPDPFNPTNP